MNISYILYKTIFSEYVSYVICRTFRLRMIYHTNFIVNRHIFLIDSV